MRRWLARQLYLLAAFVEPELYKWDVDVGPTTHYLITDTGTWKSVGEGPWERSITK